MAYRKKLIEVALPLEAINVASAREKSIRHGHPSTLHLWWARRPLAACRAVLFSSLVDDPAEPDAPQAYLEELDKLPSPPALTTSPDLAETRRQKLFAFIERLVLWENSNNKLILDTAHRLIMASTENNPPPVLDPFAGGGSIPLEAQRLGLEAHASDLNPVAVLINKALIESPPKFAGQAPINPASRQKFTHGAKWDGATGLAEDVRYYGQWMRDEAFKRIGQLYPKATLPKELGGGEATIIAWLWARTVKCPNPACGAMMPLVSSFALSTKKGKEAWVEPIIDRMAKTVQFEVKTGPGKPPEPPKMGRGAKFRCLVCNQAAEEQHIKTEGLQDRMSSQLMAVVAEGKRGRVYLSPTDILEKVARVARPNDVPSQPLANDPRNLWCLGYGLNTFDKLFTPRQLVALTTFSDLVGEARQQVLVDTQTAGRNPADAQAYADAIATYLAFGVSRLADRNSSICSWDTSRDSTRNTFARQAIPMVWDFAEANPLSNSTGNYFGAVEGIISVLQRLTFLAGGEAKQQDAVTSLDKNKPLTISTDPPYYDNIGYADLSDFFYIWLRHSLKDIYPQILSTLLVPKTTELIASPYRFEGSKQKAQVFFEEGLGKAFVSMRQAQNAAYPLTVYYAFKQAESETDEAEPSEQSTISNLQSTVQTSSTGWETMLEGLIRAGFAINGTWPMRTEMGTRMVGRGTNALASSIVLVCRPRPVETLKTTRREFIAALKRELPTALRNLQQGNIAPVDLAQATIGPGMAVFSRYAAVLESDGQPMRVRTALQLINQALDEVLAEQEGEYDADTRWAITWFEQYGQGDGPFGEAETLSRAKNTSIEGLKKAGIVVSRAGKARLLNRDELPADWSPATDSRLTNWEAAQHLIRALDKEGETGAARLLAALGAQAEIARDLAYRLYTTCERKGWSSDALAYNSLVVAWPELTRLAAGMETRVMEQGTLL